MADPRPAPPWLGFSHGPGRTQTSDPRIMSLTEPLAGPPEWWAETLTGFAEDGFDTLVFWPVIPTRAK